MIRMTPSHCRRRRSSRFFSRQTISFGARCSPYSGLIVLLETIEFAGNPFRAPEVIGLHRPFPIAEGHLQLWSGVTELVDHRACHGLPKRVGEVCRETDHCRGVRPAIARIESAELVPNLVGRDANRIAAPQPPVETCHRRSKLGCHDEVKSGSRHSRDEESVALHHRRLRPRDRMPPHSLLRSSAGGLTDSRCARPSASHPGWACPTPRRPRSSTGQRADRRPERSPWREADNDRGSSRLAQWDCSQYAPRRNRTSSPRCAARMYAQSLRPVRCRSALSTKPYREYADEVIHAECHPTGIRNPHQAQVVARLVAALACVGVRPSDPPVMLPAPATGSPHPQFRGRRAQNRSGERDGGRVRRQAGARGPGQGVRAKGPRQRVRAVPQGPAGVRTRRRRFSPRPKLAPRTHNFGGAEPRSGAPNESQAAAGAGAAAHRGALLPPLRRAGGASGGSSAPRRRSARRAGAIP